jgi:hypothetical protein
MSSAAERKAVLEATRAERIRREEEQRKREEEELAELAELEEMERREEEERKLREEEERLAEEKRRAEEEAERARVAEEAARKRAAEIYDQQEKARKELEVVERAAAKGEEPFPELDWYDQLELTRFMVGLTHGREPGAEDEEHDDKEEGSSNRAAEPADAADEVSRKPVRQAVLCLYCRFRKEASCWKM